MEQYTEPVIAYKHLLSASAYELLNKLVLDLKSKLPPKERVYLVKDNASLIYNLFIGGYEFSYKQYKEVYDFISNNKDNLKHEDKNNI